MTGSAPSALASAGASGRHNEAGPGEGTTATGKPTGAPRATGPDEERRTNAGPRGRPERHAAGHNHGTRTGAKPQRPPGAANPGSAHNTRRTAARDKMPRTAGPPRPHAAPTASGKRAPAARPKGRVVGVGERPTLDAPHPGRRRPPPGALVPPPQCAKPSRKSARCGVGDGSPCPQPPHPQPVGSAPRPHARKDKWSGVGKRPTPDAPHPGKRRPPRGTLMQPPQHARGRAVGLVTGPHARTPRTHSQWVVRPGRKPERTRGRGWESARRRTPHTQARGAPPGNPHAAATAHRARSQERALWGW